MSRPLKGAKRQPAEGPRSGQRRPRGLNYYSLTQEFHLEKPKITFSSSGMSDISRLRSSVSLAICYELRYLATEVVFSGSISMSKGHIPWPPRGRAPVALGVDVSSQNVDSESTRSDAEWAPLFVLVARAVLFTGSSFSSRPARTTYLRCASHVHTWFSCFILLN